LSFDAITGKAPCGIVGSATEMLVTYCPTRHAAESVQCGLNSVIGADQSDADAILDRRATFFLHLNTIRNAP
jgi:hypothetical protein